MSTTLSAALAALATTTTLDLADEHVIIEGGAAKRATGEHVLRLPYVDIKRRGALGNGTANDAPYIRDAVAECESTGAALLISSGTFKLDSLAATGGNFVTLTKGIRIIGLGTSSIIKIGTAITDWNHVFGPVGLTDTDTTDLSGLDVSGVVFDGNSAANPINASNPAARRYIVGAYKGDDIRIHDNHVRNWDARNLFIIDGRVNQVKNIYVYNNVGTNIGGAYWHDHSAIFASGDYVSGWGNHMVGASLGATTPSSAWSPWEIHGRGCDWHNNVCENYGGGGALVSLYTGQPGTTSKGYRWHNNQAFNVGLGMSIWPQVVGTPITDIDIHHNYFDLNIDQWPTAAGANNYPGTYHMGVALIVGNSYVERCRIEDNDFVWRTATSADTEDYGVWWVHPTSQASSGPVDKSVSISRNRFIGTPCGGIRVQWYFGLADWDVNDNLFHNIGKAGLGENLQGGLVVLDTNSLTVANHSALEDIRFNRNKFIDDQATHTLSYPLLLAAGSSRTETVSVTSGTNAGTFTGTALKATDIRSNISGTNIGANAIITAINTVALTFTMSVNATGTGSTTATLTGGAGNTNNVDMLDTQMRIEDGTAIPLSKVQASGGAQHTSFTGQAPYIRSATRAWAAPVGPARVGSEIVDTTTGTKRTQTAAPSGTTWA